MVAGVPFLVVVLLAVFFFAGSAPAGRGGEGSFCAEVGDGGGGSRRSGGGWELGGGGKTALRPSSFIGARFRRVRRMDSAVCYMVLASSSSRAVVRRLRQRLEAWGAAVVDPIALLPVGLGWFLHFAGVFFCFSVLFGPFCKVYELSYYMYRILFLKKKKKKKRNVYHLTL